MFFVYHSNPLKFMKKKTIVTWIIVSLCVLIALPPAGWAQEMPLLSAEEMTKTWKGGKTLPLEVGNAATLPGSAARNNAERNDTGINVLIDLNRTTRFVWLWDYHSQFARNGFRSTGMQATLDTILGGNPRARVRIHSGLLENNTPVEPFAWWTPPEFNVAIVQAGSPNQQQFLQEEMETLEKFVQDGGGLLIISAQPHTQDVADRWSFNKLLAVFDAKVLPESQMGQSGRGALLQLSDNWEAIHKGNNDGVLRAQREFGKGRVMIVENESVICAPNRSREQRTPENQQADAEILNRQAEYIKWLAAGKSPIGGAMLPQSRAGGGGIYPDQELIADGIVVYYAKNQTPELLHVVQDDLPKVTELVFSWLPSYQPEEPMILILSSGSGGGWAVNARLPKENGIISDDRHGIIGIYAHELAHTMRGPRNAAGGYGAMPAHDLSGEAHAGWFQGKAWGVFYDADKEKSNRDCNRILNDKEKFLAFDFVQHFQKEDPRFARDFGWVKLWWVWQKLDDKYGPTWYPRWYWVRATRWHNQPNHRQSWEETIEDMSIAVGEDLFPFFKSIGTTLSKERFAEAEFQGEKQALPIAEIEITPGKNVNLEPIGDYTQPLR
jgi:hypothetical protein